MELPVALIYDRAHATAIITRMLAGCVCSLMLARMVQCMCIELTVSAGARGAGGNANRTPGLNGVRTLLHMLTWQWSMPIEPFQPVRADGLAISRVCRIVRMLHMNMRALSTWH